MEILFRKPEIIVNEEQYAHYFKSCLGLCFEKLA